MGWAGGALLLTGVVGVFAKIAGVLVAPGIRGVALQATVDLVETVSAALAYTFAGLLVGLVCAASFELARAQRVPLWARASVVAISGLVVALASPAVVSRLQALPAIALAVVTGIVTLIAGIAALRAAHTRAIGAILCMLSIAGLVRPFGWELIAIAQDRGSLTFFYSGRALGVFAVVVQALAALVAAAWLGTRDRWRGRILANLAIILAFVVTYLAARETDGAPLAPFAVLRTSLGHAAGASLPWGIGAIAQFLVPASILLAADSLIQRAQPKAVVVSLALALLSHGAFDVPLQSLAVIASAQWVLLAMADDRSMWTALVREREERDERPPRGNEIAAKRLVAPPPSEG